MVSSCGIFPGDRIQMLLLIAGRSDDYIGCNHRLVASEEDSETPRD
jgi:hypothetical protein